jgi:hypothetical protein
VAPSAVLCWGVLGGVWVGCGGLVGGVVGGGRRVLAGCGGVGRMLGLLGLSVLVVLACVFWVEEGVVVGLVRGRLTFANVVAVLAWCSR